jgi:hypothetical protein
MNDVLSKINKNKMVRIRWELFEIYVYYFLSGTSFVDRRRHGDQRTFETSLKT